MSRTRRRRIRAQRVRRADHPQPRYIAAARIEHMNRLDASVGRLMPLVIATAVSLVVAIVMLLG